MKSTLALEFVAQNGAQPQFAVGDTKQGHLRRRFNVLPRSSQNTLRCPVRGRSFACQ